MRKFGEWGYREKGGQKGRRRAKGEEGEELEEMEWSRSGKDREVQQGKRYLD